MVFKRFSYSAVLCGLVLGNSMLALTPGKRARIMDLTKDIQNKNVNPTEARKRALAINISPKDMNDSKISELIMAADIAGIEDILNPVMAAETKTAVIAAPIKTRPVQEKPMLQQQEAVLIEDIKPDVIKELEVTKTSEQAAPKGVPAELKDALNTLTELNFQLNDYNKSMLKLLQNKSVTKQVRDIQNNKFMALEDTFTNMEKIVKDNRTRGISHEAVDTLLNNVKNKLKTADEQFRKLDAQLAAEQKEVPTITTPQNTLVDEYANKTFTQEDFTKLMLNLRTSDKLLNDADALFKLYTTASADDIEKEFKLILAKEKWSIQEIAYGYLILLGAQHIAKTNPRPDVSENDVVDALKQFLAKTIDGKVLTGVTKPYTGQISFVQILDNHKDTYLNPAKITTQPAPTTTAGIVPGVTTTGVSTTDIKPYVMVANRTYTQQQIQEYAARLKEKGNKILVELPKEAFEVYNNPMKENLILEELAKIIFESRNKDHDFTTKMYQNILPRYYLVKQRLAFYPFEKGQKQLEEMLMTKFNNDQGQPFSIGQYIDSFEQGHLK